MNLTKRVNQQGVIISEPIADELNPTYEQIEYDRALSRNEKLNKQTDWEVGVPYPPCNKW